jgi:hypothetical protein
MYAICHRNAKEASLRIICHTDLGEILTKGCFGDTVHNLPDSLLHTSGKAVAEAVHQQLNTGTYKELKL